VSVVKRSNRPYRRRTTYSKRWTTKKTYPSFANMQKCPALNRNEHFSINLCWRFCIFPKIKNTPFIFRYFYRLVFQLFYRCRSFRNTRNTFANRKRKRKCFRNFAFYFFARFVLHVKFYFTNQNVIFFCFNRLVYQKFSFVIVHFHLFFHFPFFSKRYKFFSFSFQSAFFVLVLRNEAVFGERRFHNLY